MPRLVEATWIIRREQHKQRSHFTKENINVWVYFRLDSGVHVDAIK